MIKRDIATWTRWIHIYLSMFSFATLLFFAVTGITLNHPDWLTAQQHVESISGKVDSTWISATDTNRTAKMEIVEHFRNAYSIKSRLHDFRMEETECALSFKGPGYVADAFIDRSTGEYELTITNSGALAIFNDLHKGRDTGSVWALIIDISAILMILVSMSGFLMIFFLKKKRLSGLLLSLLGGLLIVIFYYMYAK